MVFNYRMIIALTCVVVVSLTLVLILVVDLPHQDWIRVRHEDNDDENSDNVRIFVADPTIYVEGR